MRNHGHFFVLPTCFVLGVAVNVRIKACALICIEVTFKTRYILLLSHFRFRLQTRGKRFYGARRILVA